MNVREATCLRGGRKGWKANWQPNFSLAWTEENGVLSGGQGTLATRP